MSTARLQAFIIHKCAIGAAEVAQHVLPVGVTYFGVTARDRTVINQEVGSRLTPDADDFCLAERRFLAQICFLRTGSLWNKKSFNKRLRFHGGRFKRCARIGSLSDNGVALAA